MGKYLGIDASTQSISGLLIDTEAGAIIAEESINFDAHFQDSYKLLTSQGLEMKDRGNNWLSQIYRQTIKGQWL